MGRGQAGWGGAGRGGGGGVGEDRAQILAAITDAEGSGVENDNVELARGYRLWRGRWLFSADGAIKAGGENGAFGRVKLFRLSQSGLSSACCV